MEPIEEIMIVHVATVAKVAPSGQRDAELVRMAPRGQEGAEQPKSHRTACRRAASSQEGTSDRGCGEHPGAPGESRRAPIGQEAAARVIRAPYVAKTESGKYRAF